MNCNTSVQKVAVVGCGSIGASWAALFAAYGISTQVYDPNPAAAAFLSITVEEAVTVLAQLGHFASLSSLDSNLKTITSRITFTTDLATALVGVNFVQENGPESLSVKAELLSQLDDLLDASIPILTSTSGLTCSSMQSSLRKHPDRFAVGHPFNPPHLIPLVEIVGGSRTSTATLQSAKAFYSALGRKPVILRQEIPGHIANRLQSALMQEIIYLVGEGVATVDEIETAMQFGPGLRWGVMGPSVLMHLGGGPGGVSSYSEKFLAPLLTWNSAHSVSLDEKSRAKWVAQTIEVVGNQSTLDLARRRDDGIVNTLKWRRDLEAAS
jgi:3-hydroxyacyl-CoA dehydrogenase